MTSIRVVRGDEVRAARSGEGEVFLHFQDSYQEGDRIEIEAPRGYAHVAVDGVGEALVWMQGGVYTLPVPFGERRVCYAPGAFSGSEHLISFRPAWDEELSGVRDLALNPLDCHANKGMFPHASANVETRGEASFEARNAIDGLWANDCHGHWPYSSWGINRDPKAALTIDFGRKVEVVAVGLVLRADFPHDAWWREATVEFDEGTKLVCPLVKSGREQRARVPALQTRTVVLHSLVKADDPSPFPALTAIRVYGRDIR